MKKNVLIAALLLSNIIFALFLGRVAWLAMLWKNEAGVAEFAAKMWAENDICKGKKVKLRLRIEDKPQYSSPKLTERDGDFVIRDWIGYTDPLPLFGGRDSPSVQTARIMVEAYNKRMWECYSAPEKYRLRMAEQIDYWKKNVFVKGDDPKQPDESDGK